jgi:hypothetical protein
MTHVERLRTKNAMRLVYASIVASGGKRYGLIKRLAREFGYSTEHAYKIVRGTDSKRSAR